MQKTQVQEGEVAQSLNITKSKSQNLSPRLSDSRILILSCCYFSFPTEKESMPFRLSKEMVWVPQASAAEDTSSFAVFDLRGDKFLTPSPQWAWRLVKPLTAVYNFWLGLFIREKGLGLLVVWVFVPPFHVFWADRDLKLGLFSLLLSSPNCPKHCSPLDGGECRPLHRLRGEGTQILSGIWLRYIL